MSIPQVSDAYRVDPVFLYSVLLNSHVRILTNQLTLNSRLAVFTHLKKLLLTFTPPILSLSPVLVHPVTVSDPLLYVHQLFWRLRTRWTSLDVGELHALLPLPTKPVGPQRLDALGTPSRSPHLANTHQRVILSEIMTWADNLMVVNFHLVRSRPLMRHKSHRARAYLDQLQPTVEIGLCPNWQVAQ